MTAGPRVDQPLSPTDRSTPRREKERAQSDRAALHDVLEASLICHLGVVVDGVPLALPTVFAVDAEGPDEGGTVYVHGSAASRSLVQGPDQDVSVTMTMLDGIVLARSVFEHSMNYRSVVVLGTATPVDEPEEKLAALEAFTEKLLPGRWDEARQPTRKELKATSVLSMPLDEASAKIRDGGPEDGDTPDADLDVWAGYLPLVVQALEPVADPTLRPGIPVPPGLRPYRRPGLVS